MDVSFDQFKQIVASWKDLNFSTNIIHDKKIKPFGRYRKILHSIAARTFAFLLQGVAPVVSSKIAFK